MLLILHEMTFYHGRHEFLHLKSAILTHALRYMKKPLRLTIGNGQDRIMNDFVTEKIFFRKLFKMQVKIVTY